MISKNMIAMMKTYCFAFVFLVFLLFDAAICSSKFILMVLQSIVCDKCNFELFSIIISKRWKGIAFCNEEVKK